MALVLDFKVNDKATPEAKRLQAELKKLKVSVKGADAAFDNSNKKMGLFAGQTKALTNDIAKLATGYIALSGAISITKSFVKQADAMTNIHSKLVLVTKSTLDLNEAQKAIFKTSQLTRTSFEANVDLYSKMSLSTKELALSQKELLEITGLINKSMIISGTSAEGVTTLVTQLGQAFSSDFKAVAQELGTIRDQAPALYQSLLKGTGMTTAAFKKAAEEGKLSSKIIIDALKSQGIAIEKDFGKMALTVEQSTQQVGNSFTLISGKINEASGFTKSLSSSFSELSKTMDTVTKEDINDYLELSKNIAFVGSSLVAAKIAMKGFAIAQTAYSATVTFTTSATTAYSIANGLATGSVVKLTSSQVAAAVSSRALAVSMNLIPFAAVVTAIGLISVAWLEAKESQDEYNESILKIGETSGIKELNNEIVNLRAKIIELRESEEASLLTGFGIKSWSNEKKKLHAKEIEDIQELIELHEERIEEISFTKRHTEALEKQNAEFEKQLKIVNDIASKDISTKESITSLEEIDFMNEYNDAIIKQNAEFEKQLALKKELEATTKALQAEALDSITTGQEKAIAYFLELEEAVKKAFTTEQMEKFYKVHGDLINESGKTNVKSTKTQIKSVDAVQSMYGNLTGAMSNFYDEDDKRKKQQAEVTRALSLIQMTADFAKMAQSTAFTSLFVTQEAVKTQAAGATAVAIAAQSSPWTGIATAATMIGMLASVGIMLGGSGGGSGSVSAPTMSAGSTKVSNATSFSEVNKITEDYGTVDFDSFVDGIDNAVKALDQFGNIGSAISESLASYDLQIKEHEKNIKAYDDYVEALVGVEVDTDAVLRGDWSLLEGLTIDWSKVDIFAPGNTFLEALKSQTEIDKLNLERAKILKETLADGLDFSRLSIEEVFNIDKLEGFSLEKYKHVLDEINDFALIQKDRDLTDSEMLEYSELIKKGGIWEIGQDYADAISLISDVLATSTENIKSYTDSFKTSDELLADMALELDSGIAKTPEELATLFKNLKDGVDGLTDAELSFLEANKQAIDDNQNLVDDAVKNFESTMTSMAGSIDNAINSIRGNLLSTSEIQRYDITRLGQAQTEFERAVKTGDTQQASDLLNELTALSTGLSGSAFGDSTNLNQNLITQLEANKAMIDFSDEVLNVRIVASDISTTATSTSTPSVYVTNSTNNDDRLATLEAIMIEVLKTNNNVYDTLLRIKNDGLKAL